VMRLRRTPSTVALVRDEQMRGKVLKIRRPLGSAPLHCRF
jgi:hypothetical protein